MMLKMVWLICLLAVAVSVSAQEWIEPEVISPGAAPFSEDWDLMIARDSRMMHIAGPPFVWAAPLPIVPRFALAGPQAASPDVTFEAPQPLAGQSVGANFIGITLQDQFTAFNGGSIPPDTMGAVGPNHFMELINNSAAIYSRSGTRLSHVSLDSFFTVIVGGTTYPRNGTTDPRILFDRHTNRWFAIALEFGNPTETNNNILLAVCRTSDPLTGTWDKYVIPVGTPNSGSTKYLTDFDTLGLDDNGVYFGMRVFPTVGSDFAKIAATPKASLIAPSPSLGAVSQWSNITDMYSSPQPAHNQDAVLSTDRAWFVSSSATTRGNINYRSLTWSGGTPTLTSTSVLTTPAYGSPKNAPANGSTVNVDVGDDRLVMAMIRGGKLWTCRHVGVNSTGGASGVDRTGSEWLQTAISGGTLSLVQSGRVYDNAASNPRYYYYPSIMVNGQGNATMGFSGSKSTEYVGAWTSGRLASDASGTMSAPALLQAGQASYQRTDSSNRNRWGDYSFTTLDPNDDMSIWTIQEYASNIGTNIWATWISELLSPPPTLSNPGGNACVGMTGVVLNLTGTGFYDPGPGYSGRLHVSLQGGTINGISDYTVTYNSPTSVTVTFDIALSASLGSRDIVLTNPDGQSATAVGGFTVLTPPQVTQQPGSRVACIGDSVSLCVIATGSPTLTYQWSKDSQLIPTATSSCYGIASAAVSDSGSYTVTVTNSCGSATSAAALLEVAQCMTVPQAKRAADFVKVALKAKPVSAVFSDSFYVEESNRAPGLRVDLPNSGLSDTGSADVAGTMRTLRSGERYIDPLLAVPEPGSSTSPLEVIGSAVGGKDWFYDPLSGAGQEGVPGATDLNNIGLLIRISGRFTYVNSTTFTVNDGSVAVKCVVPAGVAIQNTWVWASVTGVSSCENPGTGLSPLLLVRKQSDIQAF